MGGADKVQCRRRESETDLLLEATHNGWMRRFGLMHQRRLFMDTQLDELRGEDSFIAPPKPKTAPRPGRGLRFEVFFHLHPLVRASLAQDRRSVLLMTANDGGWRLRTDAAVVTVDQGLHFVDGLPRRTQKIILRDSLARQGGGQIRWKLTRADVRA